MPQPDGLLTHDETAAQLGVTVRHLSNIVRQGRLLPAGTDTRGRYVYRPDEVYSLLQLKVERMDLPTVTRTAVQALNLARSLSGKLEKLCSYFGLEIGRLSTEEDSMHALHLRAINTAKDPDLSECTDSFIVDWAYILNAIDEPYLRALSVYTMDFEPWVPYMGVATNLHKQMPASALSNSDLRFAYACLDNSRKNLRNVAYFYARTMVGAVEANDAFSDDVDEEVIAHMFPADIAL